MPDASKPKKNKSPSIQTLNRVAQAAGCVMAHDLGQETTPASSQATPRSVSSSGQSVWLPRFRVA